MIPKAAACRAAGLEARRAAAAACCAWACVCDTAVEAAEAAAAAAAWAAKFAAAAACCCCKGSGRAFVTVVTVGSWPAEDTTRGKVLAAGPNAGAGC